MFPGALMTQPPCCANIFKNNCRRPNSSWPTVQLADSCGWIID